MVVALSGTGGCAGCAAADHLEEFAVGIVRNVISPHLVATFFHRCPDEQLHRVGAAVVFDALGPAFDIFVVAIALLPEISKIAPGRAVFEALGVLPDFHAVAADDQRALRQHNASFEGGDLFCIVNGDPVGFKVDGLVAIGFFGKGIAGRYGAADGQRNGAEKPLPGDPNVVRWHGPDHGRRP